jgi:hypothetical protein
MAVKIEQLEDGGRREFIQLRWVDGFSGVTETRRQ